MLFISVLFSRPCWAVSFLNPETMAYSLESPVPRMSQECPRGCWFGPRLCSSCCVYGFTQGRGARQLPSIHSFLVGA